MLAREVIQRVREIQVRTGRQVADVLAGQYVSVFKGRGIEFDEVRPYVPGDEIRTIDWKVTAQTGTPVRETVRRGASTDLDAHGRHLRIAGFRLDHAVQA